MPNLMELPLRDIHLPDPVSWWPLAIGWWLVIGVSFFFALGVCAVIKQYFKTTLRKEALKALDQIERTFNENGNASQCFSELSQFLRRAKLSQKDSLKQAGLTGEAWLRLLDETLGSDDFSKGIGRLLLTGPYLPQAEREDVTDLIQLCRKWAKSI